MSVCLPSFLPPIISFLPFLKELRFSGIISYNSLGNSFGYFENLVVPVFIAFLAAKQRKLLLSVFNCIPLAQFTLFTCNKKIFLSESSLPFLLHSLLFSYQPMARNHSCFTPAGCYSLFGQMIEENQKIFIKFYHFILVSIPICCLLS